MKMSRDQRMATCILILCFVAMLMGVYLILTQPRRIEPLQGGLDLIPREGVAVVYLYGPIYMANERELLFMGGADQVVKRLKRVKEDPRIKGVVLRINSPGGSVGAVQEIYEAVKDLRASGRPVVASMGDIATSGAYYVACGADKIVANPGTVTGSIGVILSIPNIKELLGKFGVKFEVIKSGGHKDMGSIFKDMSIEERRLLEGIVNNAYNQFYKAVVGSRGGVIPEEKLRQLADGRIFTGEQAKEVGLVDEIGTFEEGIRLAARLAGIKGEPHVYEEGFFPFERIFGLIEERLLLKDSLLNKIENPDGIRLEYRYLPGIL